MTQLCHRRHVLQAGIAAAAVMAVPRTARGANQNPVFEISLAERSLERSLAEKRVNHLDLARIAKTELGISAVEYDSRYFRDKVQNDTYLDDMNTRAADQGVRQLLIMVDQEGHVGDRNVNERRRAIEKHRRWIDAAKSLGCHSIQVDPTSTGNAQEQHQSVVEGLSELCEHAAQQKIHVLLGNYGGLSNHPAWVIAVIQAVNHPYCGTLPLIGKNAAEHQGEIVYEDLARLVPYARGITAMTFKFDELGGEANTDYLRALRIVRQAGYQGYVGIYYAGTELDEMAGIRASKALLERVRGAMAQQE